jgi:hypothetical protein
MVLRRPSEPAAVTGKVDRRRGAGGLVRTTYQVLAHSARADCSLHSPQGQSGLFLAKFCLFFGRKLVDD